MVNAVELAEGRVSQVFLQAIEMGEIYSREIAATLGESMVYHCCLRVAPFVTLLETQQVESVVHRRLEAVRQIDAVSPSFRPCLYLAVPARFRFRPVPAFQGLGVL